MSTDTYIHRGFLTNLNCEKFLSTSETIINRFYNDSYLKKHVAYYSDIKPNRRSYAFVIHHTSGNSDKSLPGIDPGTLGEFFFENTQTIENLLGLKKGRTLFNIQKYYDSSDALPLHCDGEYFEFSVDKKDDSVHLHKGIIPKKTAVLTLINHTEGGGTKIVDEFGIHNVEYCASGDLLIFNNSEVLHGADKFYKKDGVDNIYSRYTIGWRSLDYECFMYNKNEKMKEISYEDAVMLHKQFLSEQWPFVYERMKAENNGIF